MDSLPINVADFVVGIVLLLSALFAYMRGFVHEVLSVGGWIGAIFATIYGLPYARPFARDLIPIDLLADLAAGLAIFLVTMVLLSFFTRGVAAMVKASTLNVLDRSLGFLFGLVRGAVIICLIYLGYEWMAPPAEHPTWLTSARSMPLIWQGGAMLRALVPEDTRETGARAAEDAREKTEKALEAQRILSDMLRNDPRSPSPERPREGYDETERRRLDQLIQGNQ
jgi:membrane protein required for colicin V production